MPNPNLKRLIVQKFPLILPTNLLQIFVNQIYATIKTASAQSNVTSGVPSVTDDSSKGYSITSMWVDSSGPDLYILLDDTVGAAVWKQIVVV